MPVPQADGQRKPRPAVLLRLVPPFDDYLVCGTSSQLRQWVRGLDVIILNSDPDFTGSGLRVDSLIRAGFVAIYSPPHQIIGSVGKISEAGQRRLLRQLRIF